MVRGFGYGHKAEQNLNSAANAFQDDWMIRMTGWELLLGSMFNRSFNYADENLSRLMSIAEDSSVIGSTFQGEKNDPDLVETVAMMLECKGCEV